MKIRKKIGGAGVKLAMILTVIYLTAGLVIKGSGPAVELTLKFLLSIPALLFIKYVYKDMFLHIFTSRPPKRTLYLLAPLWAFAAVQLLQFLECDSVSFSLKTLFIITLDAGTTGFFEELIMRGTLLCGMTVKSRRRRIDHIVMCSVSGVVFGIAHLSCLFGGYTIFDAVMRVIRTGLFGFYMAAVYLYCRNIAVVMAGHALWNLAVYIPESFCVWEGFLPGMAISIFDPIGDIISYFGIALAGVVICNHINTWRRIDCQNRILRKQSREDEYKIAG